MHDFLTDEEYQNIADLFDLGKIQKIVRFTRGFQTPRVHVTTASGDFIISSYALSDDGSIISKSRASLQYEIDLLHTLTLLPVPHYIASKPGNFIEDFKRKPVTVYGFLPGEHPKEITLTMAREPGKFLGEFHTLGQNFTQECNGRRKFYHLDAEVVKKMGETIGRLTNPKLVNVVNEVRAGVEKFSPPVGFPEGPIHVDINSGNELFVGEKLTGIIDFGNFYVGPYMIDIGKTIMWNCVKDGRIDPKLTDELIKGYERHRQLTSEEKIYLRPSILYAIYSHIWVDLYHVPLGYVPESYTLYLVETFLPIARLFQNS